jgi:hypothetical protein
MRRLAHVHGLTLREVCDSQVGMLSQTQELRSQSYCAAAGAQHIIPPVLSPLTGRILAGQPDTQTTDTLEHSW